MHSKGWEQQLSMDLGEGATLVYEKDERIANITLAKEQEGTIINLVINKKGSLINSVGRLLILIRKYTVKTYGYNYEGNGFF